MHTPTDSQLISLGAVLRTLQTTGPITVDTIVDAVKSRHTLVEALDILGSAIMVGLIQVNEVGLVSLTGKGRDVATRIREFVTGATQPEGKA